MPEWLDWHDGYEGFFDRDISGYLHNVNMPCDGADTVKMADCFWSPGAYVPEKVETQRGETSARRSVALLFGKDMFDILDPAREAMAYFDKYKYGEFKPEAAKEVPELEKRLAVAEAAWKKAEAYNPFALKLFPGSLGRAITEFAPNVIKAAKNSPQYRAANKDSSAKP